MVWQALVVLLAVNGVHATKPPVAIVIEEDPQATVVTKQQAPAKTTLAATTTSQDKTGVEPSTRLRHEDIVSELHVQSALREGRRLIQQKEYSKAIEQLESQLHTTAGSEQYLDLLADAYRERIVELMKTGDSRGARLVAERLRVLAPDGKGPSGLIPTQEEAEVVVAAVAQELQKGKIPAKVDDAIQNAVHAISESDTQTAADLKQLAKAAEPLAEAMEVATNQGSASKIAAAFQKVLPVAASNATAVTAASTAPAKPTYETARGNIEDDIVAIPEAKSAAERVPCPLFQKAEVHFSKGRYAEALALYEQSYERDPVGVQAGRERWGYCLLFESVQRYNKWIERQPNAVSVEEWNKLEADVRLSKQLAPTLDYAQKVLDAIAARKLAIERHASAPAAAPPGATPGVQTVSANDHRNLYSHSNVDQVPPRSFRHLPGRSQSWSVIETDNFLIYHRDPALAEEVAQLAEEAREYAHRKWFGSEPLSPWQPRCELYLYPTAHEYSRSTGVGPQSPGHSKVLNDNGRILGRKVELRTDDPNMRHAILPHEITHVVLAGRFGPHTVPRWADEGMAVLTEPRDKQEAHLNNLANSNQSGGRYSCAQVMTMQEYPPGNRMRDFYAHSVGICRFLVERHGAAKLTAYLRQSLTTNNYETALQEVYGIQSFAILESEFESFVAGLNGAPSAIATASR